MNNTHIRYLLVVTRLIILLIPLLFHYHLVFPQWQNALLFKDEAACLTHQVFHAGCVQSKIPIFWTQMVAISTFWADSGSEPVRTWTGPYGTGSPANCDSGSGSVTQDIVGQVQVQVHRKSAQTGAEPDPGNFRRGSGNVLQLVWSNLCLDWIFKENPYLNEEIWNSDCSSWYG